jgi:hypothetical protein
MLTGEPFESQTIKRFFVNLADLTGFRKTGKTVRQFNTLQELQDYTIETERYLPKQSAYAGGVLKFLLHELLNTHVRVEGRRTRR